MTVTVVGSCNRCGEDILAPQQALVCVGERTYHRHCHQALLVREVAEQASNPGNHAARNGSVTSVRVAPNAEPQAEGAGRT